jgi:hypothetical protein
MYNRTDSHQNPLQSHSQDGPIAKTTTVPLTAATPAVAMEDDPIHTSPDTMAITTTTTIIMITAITETAIITSTAVLVRVMAGRRIADTVTEVIPIPMPDDEVKVRR